MATVGENRKQCRVLQKEEIEGNSQANLVLVRPQSPFFCQQKDAHVEGQVNTSGEMDAIFFAFFPPICFVHLVC